MCAAVQTEWNQNVAIMAGCGSCSGRTLRGAQALRRFVVVAKDDCSNAGKVHDPRRLALHVHESFQATAL